MSEINCNLPAQPRNILVLADESCYWKVGGLRQIDRILLNLREAFDGKEDGCSLNIFVFWPDGKKKSLSFTHPLLKGCKPLTGDDDDSLKNWLHSGRESVFVIKTNLLLGRGSLNRVPLPYTVFLKEKEHPCLNGTPDGGLWNCFSGLVERDGSGAYSSENGFYHRLGSVEDIDAGERRLFGTLGKRTDGLVSTLLNRPLSTRLSRYLAGTRITPTIWTLTLFCVAVSGVGVLTIGNTAGFILGTFIFQVASALDGCDGELARVRFQESKRGEWIDTVADLSGNIMFLFALGLGLSRQAGIDVFLSRLYFIEGAVTSLALLGTLWAVHGFTKKRESSGHFNNFGSSVVKEMEFTGWLKRLSLFVVKILKRDTYTLIFLLMAVFGKASWILHLMGAGITLHLAVLVRPVIFPSRRGSVTREG